MSSLKTSNNVLRHFKCLRKEKKEYNDLTNHGPLIIKTGIKFTAKIPGGGCVCV